MDLRSEETKYGKRRQTLVHAVLLFRNRDVAADKTYRDEPEHPRSTLEAISTRKKTVHFISEGYFPGPDRLDSSIKTGT